MNNAHIENQNVLFSFITPARMSFAELQKIIGDHFNDYPVEQNIKAILIRVNTGKLNTMQVDAIFKGLRMNIGFFERHHLIRTGLFNLFMYGYDALYIPEWEWELNRAPITAIYKLRLNINKIEERGSPKSR